MIIILCLAPECEQTSCPVSNRRYIERGCLPEYKDNACCPTSFSCRKSTKNLSWFLNNYEQNYNAVNFDAADEPTTGICHYRGVSYKVGDVVTQISEDNPCKTRCECVESDAQYVFKTAIATV